jgi:hypothetical protein
MVVELVIGVVVNNLTVEGIQDTEEGEDIKISRVKCTLTKTKVTLEGSNSGRKQRLPQAAFCFFRRNILKSRHSP